MNRNFNEVSVVAYDLLKKAVEDIISKLEEEFPENNLGCSRVRFGAIYIDICNELQERCGEKLEKKVFDDFMNEYLPNDKRVFMRCPVELPSEEKKVKNYIFGIYFNNLGEVYLEYADTFIARFVKKYLIKPLQESGEDSYYRMYIYDEDPIDGSLFALQHFGNYGEAEKEEMVKKMKIVAKRFNCTLEIVPEYEIYSRSESDENLYFLIKREEH